MPVPFVRRKAKGGDRMLRACQYCGRIHDSRHDCGQKPKRRGCAGNSRDGRLAAFRNSQAWKRKREEIKRRDKNICVCCFYDITSPKKFNSDGLSVHHIVSLKEDFERRLDDGNLITLCQRHHELAEAGAIGREVLLALAKIPPGGVP